MSNDLGNDVSRVLDPSDREFVEVIWQQNKPPLDSELNFLQELSVNFTRRAVLRGTPSGWIGDGINPLASYVTNPVWSNWFQYGQSRAGEQKSFLWAVVNGWVVPVGGTRTGSPPGSPNDSVTHNIIALDPPPSNSGDFRADFVFLEVWQARVAPNPSLTNKPSASAIYRYGNVEGGFSYLADDLVDPTLGFETTKRVQVQYRIRVVKGLVGLALYPDGFDPTVVKAQGAAAAPTSFVFTNMRQTLGDAGLWRAGDGTPNSLGTVDGFVYAVPICVVFRRNGVVWAGDPSQNLNGAFNRNPTAVDRTGVKTLSNVPTLALDLAAGSTTATLSTATNIGLPLTSASPVRVQVGDEILTYSAITGTTMTIVARGQNGTRDEAHLAGTQVRILSGRPDGLFADQVSKTDILDLRHLVSPSGFDYDTLLEQNVQKLFRGELRSNWKRSGAGPQGPFVAYEDKITNAGAALGVTNLDGPDNIRQAFSDASVTQYHYLIAEPVGQTGSPTSVGAAWSLSLQINQTTCGTNNQYNPGDILEIPVIQLKTGLPGGDADQVQWLTDVEIRLEGETNPLPPSAYTVTPATPGPYDDLVITLGGSFPAATTRRLIIRTRILYGPGRGLSRRPDAVHGVSYINPSTELLTQRTGVPEANLPTRVAHPMQWSKYYQLPSYGVPVTAETYVDPGSKTVVLNPLRRIDLPDKSVTLDGTAANMNPFAFAAGAAGTTNGTTTFADASVNFVTLGAAAGDALVLGSGPQPGRYTVLVVTSPTTITLDRAVPIGTLLSWELHKAQGLMPLNKRNGTTPKWLTTDPLDLFSGTTDTTHPSSKNLYISIPRYLWPAWGEYRLPHLWQDVGNFEEGINYGIRSPKGAPARPNSETNVIPYSNGVLSYALFSTVDLVIPSNPATYNAKYTAPFTYAGIRKFTDARGLSRLGLELPPFYGIARLWAVYEATDYRTNGYSSYDPSSREYLGTGATNLLRQNFAGPLFWVELDDDGDSTFILNADALDLTKCPTPGVVDFSATNAQFVVEASIFGFDRDAFDLSQECRVVLTRQGASGLMRSEAVDPIRANNIGVEIDSPTCILPGPPTGSDSVVVDYSRTPYQGDAWGSQTNYQDISYLPGPLLSGVAYQINSTTLDDLTRPYQKPLEVLSRIGFITTYGTAALSGIRAAGLHDTGYEDINYYPPTTVGAPRPSLLLGAMDGENGFPPGTELTGCTERLPLGSLWRDKDFKGQRFSAQSLTGLMFTKDLDEGPAPWLAPQNALDVVDVAPHMATAGTCQPGNVLVHVDGEQGNYSLTTNYRTTRGGSVFVGSGSHPGGEVLLPMGVGQEIAAAPRTMALVGQAMLVRNTNTSVGSTEVSAGDELMLLVVTTAQQVVSNTRFLLCAGTNGSYEGWSAADLYRIEGHPLVINNTRQNLDPSSIALTPVVNRRP